MNVKDLIREHIAAQPEAKRSDMNELDRLILGVSPKCKLWFEDGKNEEGKIVTNPNIGYGKYTIKYADGSTRDFFQVGMSATKTGISIYILGKKDKSYLAGTFGERLGKAGITGYCIKVKALKDIHLDVLKEIIQYGFETAE